MRPQPFKLNDWLKIDFFEAGVSKEKAQKEVDLNVHSRHQIP